jgi:hypothetical protein
MENSFEILKMFLNVPVDRSDKVFELFQLPGAVSRQNFFDPKERFLYIKGNRENKVLLVAHADTWWDTSYHIGKGLNIADGVIRPVLRGLGADDRAGCAIVWLLKELGHSILITDGEESGGFGSYWLASDQRNTNIMDEINKEHQFMVQFDRRNATDFKCYGVGTDEFRAYVGDKTGYAEPDRTAGSDIVNLCRDVAGVNLSVGYYNEHTPEEYLVIDEWMNTLDVCRNWLSEPDLPRFELPLVENRINVQIISHENDDSPEQV